MTAFLICVCALFVLELIGTASMRRRFKSAYGIGVATADAFVTLTLLCWGLWLLYFQ